MDKRLSDTDSIYCTKPTNSHQSSIFIAPTDSLDAYSIFGNNYSSDMDVIIVLSKSNLLLNLLSHYLDNDVYYIRSSTLQWNFNKEWLLNLRIALEKTFSTDIARFHVSINKEKNRTYLKGITAIKSESKSINLDLRNYLFSGDNIRLMRQQDGSISFTIIETGNKLESSTIVDLRNEFTNWLVNSYKKPNGKRLGDSAINSYISALNAATTQDPNGSPSSIPRNVIWYNIYQHLYGSPAPKSIFQVAKTNEFQEIFGGLQQTVSKGTEPPNVISQHFVEIQEWIKGQTGGAFLPPAMNLYEKFLQWREDALNNTNDDEDDKASLINIDRLLIALQLFVNKRREPSTENDGWFNTGREVNGKIREYFDSLTVEAIMAFKEDNIIELFCGQKDTNGKVIFEPMWSGSPGNGWGNIQPNSDEDTQNITNFLVKLRTTVGIAEEFRQNGFVHPKGFGPSVISELLMKFHPKQCIKHGEVSHKALSWLELINHPWNHDFSNEEYKQACGATAKILTKMKEMQIPRQINADGTEDNAQPDYLTVNEFLFFVYTNMDMLKEEVMNKQWKSINSKEKIRKGTQKLSEAFGKDDMLKRLVAALRTKPFAILAGHSGTGKSQLVRRLAYMTCNNDILIKEGEGKTAPGNYCMVQVKPNWHDSTDLLGYYSEMGGRHFVNTPFVQFICKAYAYPETPFFVCLDEMNLAPVEQYFAEYLSAIESMEQKDTIWITDPLVEVDKTGDKNADGKEKIDLEIVDQIMKGAASTEAAEWIQSHGLTIPKNLFVIGTVNMDETTCQFSRKVLDRAMTLLMTDVKFTDMEDSKIPSSEELLDEESLQFFITGEVRGTLEQTERELLDGINKPLSNTAFLVAYRFANEYALYEAALAKLEEINLENDEDKNKFAHKALDHVVLMKLLPRIHGEKAAVQRIFEGNNPKSDKEEDHGLMEKLPSDGLSVKMMKAILDRNDEYLTFWP